MAYRPIRLSYIAMVLPTHFSHYLAYMRHTAIVQEDIKILELSPVNEFTEVIVA